jgi:hypothetical protein
MVMRIKTACLFIAMMFCFESCKKKRSSSTKTLDNLAGGNFRKNICWSNPKLADGSSPPLATAIVPDKSLPDDLKAEMTHEALLALTAVPKKAQIVFPELMIFLTSDPGKHCTDTLSKRPEKTDGIAACYRIGPNRETGAGQTMEIILKAEKTATAIRHNLVREFGYLLAQVFSRVEEIGTDGVTNLKLQLPYEKQAFLEDKEALSRDFLSDVIGGGVFDPRVIYSYASGLTDPATVAQVIRDTVFADAFDSFYCNGWSTEKLQIIDDVKNRKEPFTRLAEVENSRAIMQKLFSRTYTTFTAYHCKYFAEVGDPICSTKVRNSLNGSNDQKSAGGGNAFSSLALAGEKKDETPVISKVGSIVSSDHAAVKYAKSPASTLDSGGSQSSGAKQGDLSGFKVVKFADDRFPPEAKGQGGKATGVDNLKGAQQPAEKLKQFLDARKELERASESLAKKSPFDKDYLEKRNEMVRLNQNAQQNFAQMPENLQKIMVEDDLAQKAYTKKINERATLNRALEKDTAIQDIRDKQAKEFIKTHLPEAKNVDIASTEELYNLYAKAQKKKQETSAINKAYYDTLGWEMKKPLDNAAKGVSDFGDNQLASLHQAGYLPSGAYEVSYGTTFYTSKLIQLSGSAAKGTANMIGDPEEFSKSTVNGISNAVSHTINDKNERARLYRDGGAGNVQSYVQAWTPGIGKMERSITDVDNQGAPMNRDGYERAAEGFTGAADFFGSATTVSQAAKGVTGKFLKQSGGFVDEAADGARLSQAANKADDVADTAKAANKVNPCLALGDTIDPCALVVNRSTEVGKLNDQFAEIVARDQRMPGKILEDIVDKTNAASRPPTSNLDDIVSETANQMRARGSLTGELDATPNLVENIKRQTKELAARKTDEFTQKATNLPTRRRLSESDFNSPRPKVVDELINHAQQAKNHYGDMARSVDEVSDAVRLEQKVTNYYKGSTGDAAGDFVSAAVDDAVSKQHFGQLDGVKNTLNESLASTRSDLIKIRDGASRRIQALEIEEKARASGLTAAQAQELNEMREVQNKLKNLDLRDPGKIGGGGIDSLVKRTNVGYLWEVGH